MSGVSSKAGEAISLNLNPMLDVFSILITFLLMSFSTDPVNYEINKSIELPESETLMSLDEVPAVVVTQDSILVNDKKVVSLFNGDVADQDKTQGAIFPLFEELKKLQTMNQNISNKVSAMKNEADEKDKLGTLTLEMDKNLKFKLIKRVMLSGQQAEFINYKMMVSKQLQ